MVVTMLYSTTGSTNNHSQKPSTVQTHVYIYMYVCDVYIFKYILNTYFKIYINYIFLFLFKIYTYMRAHIYVITVLLSLLQTLVEYGIVVYFLRDRNVCYKHSSSSMILTA